ncbi:alanine--tRNA ligase [Desulfovibrio legallii]|uniref:Alanine--tRNA ligase n=1 Tax=Desulfovibrio legallii TaxID=571438 RepID=A0A1G7LXZ5_9BACT|nr:alanine--tRNA ligase [Desulfovibrio legallii]SDF54254.1 alanyl-tRNA synthetase [Desulfovibrio legallii]
MLTAKEIRRRYLEFFHRHQHAIVPSGPIIPPNDPTLLFTNAGMVQFKKLFLGEEKRAYSRATTCQKCLRVSGKHNDLENVGRTARHHTFFEMLGNFSFGDYFKREAITWAWEFVTKELGLPKEKLWVTVYREDDEAAALWAELAGLPEERIVRMGEKDNFWTMGDTGPCGPCSEIYVDQGEAMACGPECGIGKCDCDRFLEIWNLVFTQFDQAADGTRTPLARPNIDTGMGLERMAAVVQGKRSNFDCDLFQEIIQYAAGLAGVTYSYSAPDANDVDTALRVIADHSRAAAFLIAGGVLPSNESRGYVLRRLIRRALRFATLMGVHEPFMHKVARKVTEVMGDAYPELVEHADFIARAVFEEEQRFSLTLQKGLELLDEELGALKAAGQTVIPGDFCFRLYDTYGFPLDIVTDVAEKRGFAADAAGFETHMAQQRARAREHQKKGGLLGQSSAGASPFQPLLDAGLSSAFVGYERLTAQSPVTALRDSAGAAVEVLGEGETGYVVTESTPFYGEGGGQAGDAGRLRSASGAAAVRTTLKPAPALLVHEVHVDSGELRLGDTVELTVDEDRRAATARNHTCTHLLHAALRRVLGSHVKQAGSLVDGAHLRFDFSHIAALSPEELAAVERQVNRAIMADMPVATQVMPVAEAMASGAMALFGEKYGDTVRVLTVAAPGADEPESVELCGGTHLARTGQAGAFLIVSESGVAAGVRRIEAVTGWNAYARAVEQRAELGSLAEMLKARPGQLAERVQALHAEIKKLRKASEKAAPATGADLAAQVKEINGLRLLAARLDGVPVKALRGLMDDVRSRLPEKAVACLATVEDGKVGLLVYVSKDLHNRFTAPALIKEAAAPCGGSGGGRPDMAQAGGTKPEGLEAAFALLHQRLLDA